MDTVYSRDELLALRRHASVVYLHIPEELWWPRAGAKVKARHVEKRWRYKPSIPSVVMWNVNSLANKPDALAALVRNPKIYKECSLLCFSQPG